MTLADIITEVSNAFNGIAVLGLSITVMAVYGGLRRLGGAARAFTR